jgi:hypothetical protein
MRPVGVGRLTRHDDGEAIGESVLDSRANADVGLDPRNNDPLGPLLAQEERLRANEIIVGLGFTVAVAGRPAG